MAEEVTETENVEGVEAPKGGLMKKLVLGVSALVLVGGGIFAGMTFFGTDESAADNAEPAADNAAAKQVAVAKSPALYTSLHPPLVVNFKDSSGASHFMQITMEVMAREQTVINAVREHTPVIRNALILLYSSAIYDEVTTLEGKKKMLADGLKEIQGVMTQQIGEAGIEAVYFTALVIQ